MTRTATCKARLTEIPETFEELDEALNAGVFPEHIRDEHPTADNVARAGFAAKAFITYARTTRVFDGEGFETGLGDLMGDLMHLCDVLDVDFDQMVDKGRFHYQQEVIGR